MVVLKRIGVLSAAKLEGLLMVIFGLIMGIIFAVFGAAGATLSGFGAFGASVGILAIIIMPIFYGIIGFIGGAVGAFLYNLIAGWIGGIELELVK